ncbi:phasin family protein [Clostridium sp. YIM B02551]|uniref:phasin family protein n=1 Tax=Clostridium sp. YIM B02551 TaxID=2910679 RepID=UPI001EE9CCF6|nr:hypothetical protein [Clostridium sp. YIM B02551]
MISEVKKLLLAGVGAVSTTYEKASEVIDELVEKGRITVEDGKELTEELKTNFSNKAKEVKPLNREDVEGLLRDLGYVKREELNELVKRIEALEQKTV